MTRPLPFFVFDSSPTRPLEEISPLTQNVRQAESDTIDVLRIVAEWKDRTDAAADAEKPRR